MTALDNDAVDLIEKAARLMGGYDLQENDLGNFNVPTWEGFPTKLFSYKKIDQDGTIKNGLAVMLNPTPRQVAKWIVRAVVEASGTFSEKFARRLLAETLNASGFQFVLRGVHLEAMDDSPSHTSYPFFDGVTVKLRGIADGYPTRPLSKDELKYTTNAPIDDVTQVGKYARIQSTTREEYVDAGGEEDVSGSHWLDVTRRLYQAAWGQDNYELMTAKAKANKARWGF